ncbi:MAG: prepilin-type N-terminal cleavage/methylation domain-containing protein [Pyrinomonadaceae bacterium]
MKGFTLLEFLIASLLLLIVTLGALNFVSRANARLMELAEAEELEHRRSVVLANLRHDFEQAGMHLLPPQLRVNSQEPVYLATTPHYQTENLGRCRKLTDETGVPTTSARGMYASGWLQFKPQHSGAGKIGFIGQDGSVTALEFLPNEATGGGELRYYKEVAGVVVVNPTIDSAHLPGDYYRLFIDGEQPLVTIKVYRVKQAQPPMLLATYVGEDAQYPYRPMAELAKTGAELHNMLMSGTANAVAHTGPPLLPVDTAVGPGRLPSVVNITAPGGVFESVSLLQGDINVDTTRLLNNVKATFAGMGAETLDIKSPCNGKYHVGDVITLIDSSGEQQRSALYRVVVRDPVTQCGAISTLTLERVTAELPSWERLFSTPADYNFVFLRGTTQLVKILPPVTYRLDRANGNLLRREGKRESTVARGVVEFSVTQRAPYGVTSYEINCQLRREGFTSPAGGSATGFTTVSLVVAPRALSQTYEYQKLGRPME